jgi:hypothetical protein
LENIMQLIKRRLFSLVAVVLVVFGVLAPLTSAQQLPPQLIEVVGKWGVTPETLGTLVQGLGAAQGDPAKIVEALTAANIDPKLLRRFMSETDPQLVAPLLQAVGIDPATVPSILEQFDQAAFDKELADSEITPEDLDAVLMSASEEDFNALMTELDLSPEELAQFLWFYTDTTIEDPYEITDDVLNAYISQSGASPEEVLAFWGITEEGLKGFLAEVANGADIFELAGQLGFSPENVLDIVYSLGDSEYAQGLLEEAGLDPEEFYAEIDAVYAEVAFDGSVEEQEMLAEEGGEGEGTEGEGTEGEGTEGEGEGTEGEGEGEGTEGEAEPVATESGG